MLIGEAGTGKTTLLRAALQIEPCRHVKCVYMDNPTLTRNEFVEILATRFGLTAHAARSKAGLLADSRRCCTSDAPEERSPRWWSTRRRVCAPDLLEEIRLLANIETQTEKLLPLVSPVSRNWPSGLNDPELRQLKQRVALRCEIKPLELSETAAYIASRIRTAGGEPRGCSRGRPSRRFTSSRAAFRARSA